MFMRLTQLLVLVVCLGVAASAAAQDRQYNRIIAFGDSYTDDALGFDDTNGFNRYTNGPVWVEYLGKYLDIATIDNRAWGGAKTGYGGASGIDWSGLAWQVEHFSSSGALAKTLVTVWIGYNDVYDGEAVISESIQNVANALGVLADKGVKHLLILNLPTIAEVPAYNKGNAYADRADSVQSLVHKFNNALKAMLFEGSDSFTAQHPNVDVHFFDAHSLFQKMVNNGAFENVQEPWHGTHEYPKPGEYMWWDNWHPMTEVHRRIAAAIAENFN